MTRKARRAIITAAVLLVALVVIAVVLMSPGGAPTTSSPQTTPPTASPGTGESTPAAPPSSQAQTQPATTPVEARADAQPHAPTEPEQPVARPAPVQPLTGLRAVAPVSEVDDRSQPPQPLGSLDPRRDHMLVQLTRAGAGITSIAFSDIWNTAEARNRARRYMRQLSANESVDIDALGLEDHRYVLITQQPFVWAGGSTQVPALAAHSIEVNGSRVPLLSEASWSQTGPGQFATDIIDEGGNVLLRVVREFRFGATYDIALIQRIENRSTQPLEVRWTQYGPPELPQDPTGYIDIRRFDFGYLPRPQTNPTMVRAGDSSVHFDRNDVLKMYSRSIEPNLPIEQQRELRRLWPNRSSQREGWELSWFSSSNRYFGLVVHPLLDSSGAGPRSLASSVEEVRLDVSHPRPDHQVVFTFLLGPNTRLEPLQQRSLNLGVYAGPLDRHVLSSPPYSLLAMRDLILYQISGMCGWCTFQWLAHLLLAFLSLLHTITRDWGIAIIGLVIVVRALLHPLTKKSQISMQRFAKSMSAMKPEMDKLREKYKNDPKRAQAENIKLMREHGVNPLQMLGCLPMLLQTPIWIALWAMLYLAFDIRQEPAFYGFFQLFGNWQFLGDLSSPDHFALLPGGGFRIPLIAVHIDAFNLLPLLLGVVFFIQQKYMSPPPTPNMTPEQIQSQRIMKIMMVVMFPLFLYKAPSGLTLYIITSSVIGILESRYIRKHIDELDPKGGTATGATKPAESKKPKDRLARFWAEKLAEAKRRRQEAQQKSYKKRK